MSQLYALIVLFTDCTRAASFRNYRASKPKLGQMSKYLTACKMRKSSVKCLSLNEGQSSALKVEVLCFRCFLI